MEPFKTLVSPTVVLARENIDTDQIIPARFLKGTSKVGLAKHLFADWRTQPGFPLLAAADGTDAQILVTGVNFGCGSSREHAPWALMDYGFRAIIARSFADIFKQNATKNGLLPVELPGAVCSQIEQLVNRNAASQLRIDLATQRVTLPDGNAFPFEIDPFAKHCLTNGIDELGYILSFSERIAAHEQR